MKLLPILSLLITIFAGHCLAQDADVDVQAKAISGRQYVLSDEDRAEGIYGTIKLAIKISAKGDVERAVVYIGPGFPCGKDLYKRVDAIMRGAEDLAKTYKFSPAMKNGKAVDTEVSISMDLTPQKALAAPAAGANVPKMISGGVLNGKALSLPKPNYPAEARAQRLAGSVSVAVLIGEDGNVIKAQATAGPPLLQSPSRESACGAKFSPTTLQGSPVKVSGTIVYNYVP